jgi:hypothetical protein
METVIGKFSRRGTFFDGDDDAQIAVTALVVAFFLIYDITVNS